MAPCKLAPTKIRILKYCLSRCRRLCLKHLPRFVSKTHLCGGSTRRVLGMYSVYQAVNILKNAANFQRSISHGHFCPNDIPLSWQSLSTFFSWPVPAFIYQCVLVSRLLHIHNSSAEITQHLFLIRPNSRHQTSCPAPSQGSSCKGSSCRQPIPGVST